MGHLPLLPTVEFDHAAATAAASACRETARALRTTLDERSHGAVHAQRSWTGGHAERFRRVADALRTEGRTLHDRLEATARAIDDAADAARTEQRRRDRENDERRRLEELRRRERATPVPR